MMDVQEVISCKMVLEDDEFESLKDDGPEFPLACVVYRCTGRGACIGVARCREEKDSAKLAASYIVAS